MKEKVLAAVKGRTMWAFILIVVIMLSILTPQTTFVMLSVIALGALLEVWALGRQKDISQDNILYLSLFVMTALTCFMVLRVALGYAFSFQFVWMVWAFDGCALFGGLTCSLLWETHKIDDTISYFVGRPVTISPKKSWEGAIVGLVAGLASVYLTGLLLTVLGIAPVLVLAQVWPQLVAILVFGHLGDFLESYFKRWKVDVKDSSPIFKGHGGVLDRFDAFMFASIAVVLLVLVGLL